MVCQHRPLTRVTVLGPVVFFLTVCILFPWYTLHISDWIKDIFCLSLKIRSTVKVLENFSKLFVYSLVLLLIPELLSFLRLRNWTPRVYQEV